MDVLKGFGGREVFALMAEAEKIEGDGGGIDKGNTIFPNLEGLGMH